jgi:preprotein translocase subunit YajC
MLISKAYAQEVAIDAVDEAAKMVNEAPSMVNTIMEQTLLVCFVVLLFYVLFIRPQQKRFQQQKEMLDSLEKGDKVITAGGLVGKIDKFSGDTEAIVDLGNNIKVTAMRHTLQAAAEKKKEPAAKSGEKKK